MWKRRDCNVTVIHLANYPMDIKGSWHHYAALAAGRRLRDANLIAHCDGGRWDHGCSAVAWIIEASWQDNVSQIVVMARLFLGEEEEAISSFGAEVCAMDAVITYPT